MASRDRGWRASDNLTTGTYLAQWLADVAPGLNVRPKTVESYRWAIEKYLIPGLGARPLRDLSPEDVEAVLSQMSAGGLSRNSLRIVRVTLSRALAHAERRQVVTRNVTSLVVMPHDAKRGVQGRGSIRPEQLGTFVEAIRGHRLEAMWLTLLMLGLRPGEAAALCWDDVDLDRLVLHVTRTRRYESGKMTLGPPKTKKSTRSLGMPAKLADAYISHRERQIAEAVAAGPAWQDNGLVFCTNKGAMLDPANIRHSLARIQTSAGLDHFVPYELRHSATSLLSDAGVSIEEIADLLGHANTSMVEQVYRHRV